MTAAVFRSTPSLTIPPTQNTAPVLEFNCLFTHDLRRKQKRWQDGFLRYHTFNKRIMVYDVPRNFIGDMHWTEGGAVQEGDEVTLEKGGVLVQVAEAVGQTETDLSELLQRKDRSSPTKARHSASPSACRHTPASRAKLGTAPTTQLKHRSLNALLGTPKGLLGKAVLPVTSPFQDRQQENEAWEDDRAAKRQKTQDWNVTRTVTTPRDQVSRKPERVGIAVSSKLITGQKKLAIKEVIDISSDAHDAAPPSSDTILPSSPPAAGHGRQLRVDSITPRNLTMPLAPKNRTTDLAQSGKTGVEPSSVTEAPTFPHPAAVERSRNSANVEAKHTNRITGHDFGKKVRNDPVLRREHSPAVSTTNRITNVDSSVMGKHLRSVEDDGDARRESQPLKRGAILKLVSTAPRKMLVCQQPKRTPSHDTAKSQRQWTATTDLQAHSSDEEDRRRSDSHRKRLQERLAQIGKKKSKANRTLSESPEPRDINERPAKSGVLKRKVTTKDSSEGRVTSTGSGPIANVRKTDISSFSKNMTSIQWRAEDAEQRESSPAFETIAEAQASRALEKTRSAASLSDFVDMSLPDNEPSTAKEPIAVPVDPREQSPITKPSTQSITAPRAPRPAPKLLPSKALTGGPARQSTLRKRAKTVGARKQTPNLDLRAAADPTTSILLSKPFKAPSAPMAATALDTDLGAWSREAFDLMDWRPPDRDRDQEGREIGRGDPRAGTRAGAGTGTQGKLGRVVE